MSDRVCLLRIGDGRGEYHNRSWESAQEALPTGEMDHVLIDDSAHELGFSGAIAEGWRQALETGADWVFHLELDFTFARPVPLERMIRVLTEHSYLVQMSLKRQPWNEEEKDAGGIVECCPDDFTQRTDRGDVWTEQRRYFTTNPSLYPAALCNLGWPKEGESEGRFTHRLLADPDARFGIWGPKFDPPAVEHIGAERQGTGY